MKSLVSFVVLLVMVLAVASSAHHELVYQVSEILDYKTELNLTNDQVQKLNDIVKNAREKINTARQEANIRLGELEDFSADWSTMHGIASRKLVEEYYSFMSDVYKTEINAVLQARGVLSIQQMKKYEQLKPIIALDLEAPAHEMTAK